MDEKNINPELEREGEELTEQPSAEAGIPEEAQADMSGTDAATDGSLDELRGKLDKTADFSAEELESELNRLTETFRSELKKTADDQKAADDAELVQELDDIKDEYEPEAIPEDMLCKCCGERRRDTSFGDDYEYCNECREGMKRYPIGIQYLLLGVLVIAFAAFSVYSFGMYYSGFNSMYKAEKYSAKSEMTSAQTAYSEAGTFFSNLETRLLAKRAYRKSSEYVYNTFSDFSLLQNLVTQLDSVFSETEYKLPWNKKYKEMRDSAQVQYATASSFYAIFAEYPDASTYTDLPYDEVMQKIEALIGKTASYSDSGTDTSGNSYDNGIVTLDREYDECFLRFLQYIFAYNCDKDEDMDKFIVLAAEGGDDYLWLYGYEYGAYLVRADKVSDAEALADKLVDRNVEDVNAYALLLTATRAQNKLEQADEICTKAEEHCDESAEILRQRAILDMLSGDYDSAFELMAEAADLGLYYNTVFTYEIAASLAGKTAEKAQMESTMASYGVEYSERCQQYWNNEITLEQLFTEGSADVL